MNATFSSIFSTIKQHNFLLFILSLLLAFSILSEFASFYKLENLHNQKETASEVYNLGREDLDLTNIQFRGKNTLLRHEGNALLLFYTYDYLNNLTNKDGYQNEVTKLQNSIKKFNQAASDAYTQEELTQEEIDARQLAFEKSYQDLITQIDAMIENNYQYEILRFKIQLALAALLLLLTFLSLIWIPRKLNNVVKQFESLQSGELNESRSASARNAKSETAINPAYLDQESGIHNHKGFMYEASSKKTQTLGNYSAICIFAIDNLSTIETKMPSEFTQALIKKVAFMLTLYRAHNDVIGRIEHNQFAIFISRSDKASAVNDCELIRKSIEETPFKTNDGRAVKITISGGFVQKMSTQNLEEIMGKANKVLAMSIQHGGNRIAQLRDKSTALK